MSVLRCLRRDEGMNIFEVVFAAFIMFFVLTAMLGLVAATTDLGVDAKQRNLLSNTIASRMEYARSLPFDQVGVSGTATDGVLPPSETFTRSGYTVTVTYSVRGGDSGTKELRLTVTCAAPGRQTITSTAFSTIRDRAANLTRQTGGDEGPQLEVAGSTPAPDSCVYDNLVWSPAGVLDIGVDVLPGDSGSPIVSLEIFLVQEGIEDVIFLRDGTTTYSDSAQWEYDPGSSSVHEVFTWHTGQLYVNDDGDAIAVVPDGWQTIRIRARDEAGEIATAEIRYFVDNFGTEACGTPAITVNTSLASRAVWTAGEGATMYDVRLYKQRSSGTGGITDTGSWETSDTPRSTSGLNVDLITEPFSRYVATVLARSPRFDAPSAPASAPFCSRPVITGTAYTTTSGNGSKKKATTVSNLTVSRPTFPCSGNLTYMFYYRHPTLTNGAWQLASTVAANGSTTATLADTRTWTCGNAAIVGIDYKCVVSFTPAGSVSGGPTSTETNVIGQTTAGSAVTAIPHLAW